MFVISSLQKVYIGEVVVEDCGMSRMVTVGKTIINVPINLHRVNCIEKKENKINDDVTFYQIVFQFDDDWKTWDFYKESDRDIEYKKLTGLSSVGLFCSLGDVK